MNTFSVSLISNECIFDVLKCIFLKYFSSMWFICNVNGAGICAPLSSLNACLQVSHSIYFWSDIS